MEDLIRWKKELKCFWLNILRLIFEIKIFLVRNEKYLCQCHLPYTMQVGPHKRLCVESLGSCNLCIIYLHLTQVCLKVTIAMLYYCSALSFKKTFQILWKMFLIPSPYILEKILLVNKYKKQMCYKKNKSLFFWRHKKWPNFSFKSLPYSIW